jgi:hypothetical protein
MPDHPGGGQSHSCTVYSDDSGEQFDDDGLNASTGKIAGVASGSGTSSFTVQATDQSTPSVQIATAALSIAVATTPMSLLGRSVWLQSEPNWITSLRRGSIASRWLTTGPMSQNCQLVTVRS